MKKNTKNIGPPVLAQKLLGWFLKDELAEEVSGDLQEKFDVVKIQRSGFRAKINYWYQVLSYLRPFAIRSSSKNSNSIIMFRHYFKISYRSLLKQKGLSSIKIGGLSLGITGCILIGLFIQQELSYDKFYKDGERIYRLANQYAYDGGYDRWINLQGPIKPLLDENFPEIEKVARTVLWNWVDAGDNYIRPIESTSNVYEEGFIYADPELLEILEIPMVYGSQKLALTDPNSIVISESKAAKYFANEDPVGRQIILNDNPERTYTIGGVMTDFPKNSHLDADFIMTMTGRTFGPGVIGWCCSNYSYYVKVAENTNKQDLESKITTLDESHIIGMLEQEGKTGLDDWEKNHSYYLQPIENVYLNPEKIGDHIAHGDSFIVWIFVIIAGVILFLGCINFINLTTAKFSIRTREVGMRKVVGSNRLNIINQYISESVIYSLLSVIVGVFLAWILLPIFNTLLDKSLIIPWFSWWFFTGLFCAAVLIGIFSGIYPAFFLSRFKPIEALKGSIVNARRSNLQNLLVIFQFTITIILLISAVTIFQQYDYWMNSRLGFEKDQVINIHGMNVSDEKKESFKNELLRRSDIQNVTISDFLPVEGGATNNITFWPRSRRELDPGVEAARWIVDENYINTLGMEILEGRDFRDISSDEQGIILNETMAKSLNLEDPIGTEMIDMFDGQNTVIGVVKDFHFESLGTDIRPLVMVKGIGANTVSVKVASQDMTSALKSINDVWEEFMPNQTIRYNFMDQRFEFMYDELRRVAFMFMVFAGLSIVIACLGLFALSTFVIERRSKEVSMRKVLGANVNTIFRLLTFNFVKLILVATIVAIPLGWLFMDEMLSDLANRIELQWWTFLSVSVLAMLIAILTISFESIRAALINPAKRLRSE